MSYRAYGNGMAKLKDEVNKEALYEKLDKIVDDYWGLEYEEELNGYIPFYDSENYHEEDIMNFLNALIPYITEGKIKYSDEEDCYWMFEFNPETNVWDELDGGCYYAISDLPDNFFIDELERRGYVVSKGE